MAKIAGQKKGLNYFSVDVEFDDKVRLIDAKFGPAGLGILLKVWQIIYQNSYFIKWTERELLLYKLRINADINLINDVINECLEWEIFDKTLYERFQILTSCGIQKRYLDGTIRRKEVGFIKEYLLVELPDAYTSKVNVNINSLNADINKQSKVKKSKVNESKVNHHIHDDNFDDDSADNLNQNSETPYYIFLEQEFGRPISKTEYEVLEAYEVDFSNEMIIEAISRAVLNQAFNMRYILTILQSWKMKGISTLEGVKIEDERFKKRKAKKAGKPISKQRGSPKLSSVYDELKKETASKPC